MLTVALKGLAGRKVRALLTAIAIILGVAMISGTYVLTDTINSGFNTIFSRSYQNADVVISGKAAFDTANGESVEPPSMPQSLLAKIQKLPGVALAAGKLGGPVGAAIGEPNLLQEVLSPRLLRLLAGNRQRQEDVLLRRQHREQVEELEDEADVLTAQLRDLGVAEAAELCARDPDRSGGRAVERGHDVHQRRLARARRAHDRGQLALLNVERHSTQRLHCGVALAVTAGYVMCGNDCGRRALGHVDRGYGGSFHIFALPRSKPGLASLPA